MIHLCDQAPISFVHPLSFKKLFLPVEDVPAIRCSREYFVVVISKVVSFEKAAVTLKRMGKCQRRIHGLEPKAKRP